MFRVYLTNPSHTHMVATYPSYNALLSYLCGLLSCSLVCSPTHRYPCHVYHVPCVPCHCVPCHCCLALEYVHQRTDIPAMCTMCPACPATVCPATVYPAAVVLLEYLYVHRRTHVLCALPLCALCTLPLCALCALLLCALCALLLCALCALPLCALCALPLCALCAIVCPATCTCVPCHVYLTRVDVLTKLPQASVPTLAVFLIMCVCVCAYRPQMAKKGAKTRSLLASMLSQR